MIKISLDFDNTLTRDYIQEFVIQHFYNNPNFELWIHTRRCKEYDSEVIEVAQTLDIPEERVVFCCAEYKVDYLIKHEIDLHLDDDETEIAMMPLGHENIICWVKHPDWMNKCLTYLSFFK